MPESAAHDPRLHELAAKLFWWKGPDEAPAHQRRFLARRRSPSWTIQFAYDSCILARRTQEDRYT